MLEWTFCHLAGLSVSAEAQLWQKGVLCWRDLRLRANEFLGQSTARKVKQDLDSSELALQQQAWGHFLQALPPGERVRIWPHVIDHSGFLDIETTGLSIQDRITTVALLWKGEVKTYVRSVSLRYLARDLREVEFLVTYNGDRFDLPLLHRELGLNVENPHLDMWPELYSRGFRGGLKACERQLKIHRKRPDLTGANARLLWAEHLKGTSEALPKLLQYNAEDVVNLRRILVRVYAQSMASHPMSMSN